MNLHLTYDWHYLRIHQMETVAYHIHTYLFIPLIQSLHQLHLSMEHFNEHQTTQDT